MPAPPTMVLPPPAPQTEAEGIARGKPTPEFTPAPNPITGQVGGGPTRRDEARARHPMTKRFTPRG